MARARILQLLVLTAVLALAVPAFAQAASRAPHLIGVRCVPASAKGCKGLTRAQVGAQVQLVGTRLYKGMRVSFRWETGALATKLEKKKTGWIARIPSGTKIGMVAVTVRDRAGRRSNRRHVSVKARAAQAPKRRIAAPRGSLPDPFTGNGIWIWEMPKTEKGNTDQIALRARLTGLRTVFIKSGDGATRWAQFSPALIAALHGQGLKVCAWQFVYGADPAGEAKVAIDSIESGADCFVIDAETKYEGHYGAAQQYMEKVRDAVGDDYPIGLTSFPYVSAHPRLPYSVFMGPHGAQANLPQVYWKTIGSPMLTVSQRTMIDNRVYGVPLAPLGQSYGTVAAADIRAFRRLWLGYGVEGMSWWSWQSTPSATWAVIGEPDPAPDSIEDPGWPLLHKGSRGDLVVWLQQHLASTDPSVGVDGRFETVTERAVEALQTANGLPATGETDAATWDAVLALGLAGVDWTGSSSTATPTGEVFTLGEGDSGPTSTTTPSTPVTPTTPTTPTTSLGSATTTVVTTTGGASSG